MLKQCVQSVLHERVRSVNVSHRDNKHNVFAQKLTVTTAWIPQDSGALWAADKPSQTSTPQRTVQSQQMPFPLQSHLLRLSQSKED